MKIEKKLTDKQLTILKNIKTNYNETLNNLTKDNSIIIQSHIVNMLLEGFENPQPIILPTLSIAYNSSYGDDTKFSLSTVSYHIFNEKSHKTHAFPIAHIYRSGHVCMGTIFIPSSIPKLTPMYPLEALLHNNNRHFAHGNPTIPVTKSQKEEILKIIYKIDNDNFKHDNDDFKHVTNSSTAQQSKHKLQLTKMIKNTHNHKYEYDDFVNNDLLWKISNYILVNIKEYKYAKTIMTQIYNIIFP